MVLPPLGFMGSQEHMDCSSSVEGTKDKISLVLDMIQHGGNCVSKCKVESPVAGGGKGNCFSTDICGKDLGGVGPRHRALTLVKLRSLRDTHVVANEATKRKEQAVTAWDAALFPSITQVVVFETTPLCPKRPIKPPTKNNQNAINTAPAMRVGRRPHRSIN